MTYRHYLVIDLEATCDERSPVFPKESEIIEIGAVMVDGRQLDTIGEFQTFVRPVRHPVLTAFCTQLTSITQAEVDAACGFADAIAALGGFIAQYSDQGWPQFCSWGDYDKHQFAKDAAYHGVALPLGSDHINLKTAFSRALRDKKRYGMSRALKRVGIELEGTHHRGIDDARNIAKLLPYAVERRAFPPAPPGWRQKSKDRRSA